MMPFDKCPNCGGEMIHKQVEKLLRGGNDVAVITAEADVCPRCGERLFDIGTVRRFEEIRAKLENHNTADLLPVGRSFQAT